jgi:hypothetical protein
VSIRITFQVTVLLFVSMLSMAQNKGLDVSKTERSIGQLSHEGLSIVIELDCKSVEKAWLKKLKEYGKVESAKGGYWEVKIAATPFSQSAVWIGTTIQQRQVPVGCEVFWTFGSQDKPSQLTPTDQKEAEKILKDFALECYRQDLNQQIAETEKAIESAVKQHDGKAQAAESIRRSLDRNRNEKARLETQFIENGSNYLRLKSDSLLNKEEEAGVLIEIDRLRKIAEEKRNGLRDFN